MCNTLSTRIHLLLIILNLLALSTSGRRWNTTKDNVPEKFRESPANCNPHYYTMTLNLPVHCSNESVFLLVLVRSIPENSLRREIIRRTWGSLKEVKEKTVKVAFLFGNNTSDSNDIIKNEHATYQDILQESFPESYETLDLKTVMAWKWTLTNCPNATFVIVCNDEMFVDVFKTVSYTNKLIETNQHEGFYGCWMEREGHLPNRNLTHKHGVSLEDYPGNDYPAFCNGNGYLASQAIIRKMYEISLNTPSSMPDDVWTGILAAKLSLVISNIHEEIRIDPDDMLLNQYESFDQYVQENVLLFPLDRLHNECEVCIVDHIWPRIMQYNTPLRSYNGLYKNIFHDKYLLIFLLCFLFNITILSCNRHLIFRNRPLLLLINIICLVAVLFKYSVYF